MASSIEIDQSGKFEQLNTHTVIACANKERVAIRLAAGVKRSLIQILRKSLIPNQDFYAVIFAVLVFILLSELDELPGVIVIDEEYTGKERIIRETLDKLLHRKTKGKWKGDIRFKQIGKSSTAHSLAWRLHRQKKKTIEKKVTQEDVLRWWQ